MKPEDQLGKYKLVKMIGRGGGGEVWQAECPGGTVAVKLIPEYLLSDQGLVDRLKREALATRKLAHPGIIKLHEFCEEDGRAFLVMELLKGETVAERIRREKTLPVDEVERIAVSLAETLAFIHSKNVIHRDLKPDNVFLTEDGKVKLIDLGIAKLLNEASMTMTGSHFGTPAYMSPESFRDSKHVTAATDMWAFGVMLYEISTGQLPFAGSSAASIIAKISDTNVVPQSPVRLRTDLPEKLSKTIERCLDNLPENRPTASSIVFEWTGQKPSFMNVSEKERRTGWDNIRCSVLWAIPGFLLFSNIVLSVPAFLIFAGLLTGGICLLKNIKLGRKIVVETHISAIVFSFICLFVFMIAWLSYRGFQTSLMLLATLLMISSIFSCRLLKRYPPEERYDFQFFIIPWRGQEKLRFRTLALTWMALIWFLLSRTTLLYFSYPAFAFMNIPVKIQSTLVFLQIFLFLFIFISSFFDVSKPTNLKKFIFCLSVFMVIPSLLHIALAGYAKKNYSEKIIIYPHPVSTAVGDVTGDGISDIVIIHRRGKILTQLEGIKKGVFKRNERTMSYSARGEPAAVILADLDHKAPLDVLVAYPDGNMVGVSFYDIRRSSYNTSAKSFSTGKYPLDAAAGDVNDDGWTDIITANYKSNNVSVILGKGNREFSPPVEYSTGGGPASIAVADVNGDKILDIIVACEGDNEVCVLPGKGDGTFFSPVRFPVGDSPGRLKIYDMSGDQVPDIIVYNKQSKDFSILWGYGDGGFKPENRFKKEGVISDFDIADMNRDGVADLIIARRGSREVSIAKGNHLGEFILYSKIYLGSSIPKDLTVNDVNDDGSPDIIVTSELPPTVSIFLNTWSK